MPGASGSLTATMTRTIEPGSRKPARKLRAIQEVGKKYEFNRYDGCGHAFFNQCASPTRPEFRPADGGTRFSRSQDAAAASEGAARSGFV